MTQQATKNSEKILSFRIGEKFTQAEMEEYAAEIEEAVATTGQVRLLIIMEKFPKIEPAAFWEDLKFSIKHYDAVERVALVGQPEWEKWYAKLVNLFPFIEVKHFDMAHMQTAYDWLGEE